MPTTPRNFDWLIAQIGVSPAQRRFSRSLLLTPDDLGDGWAIHSDRSWPVGGMVRWRSGGTDASRRARKAKCVTAWRDFECASLKRWTWIQVAPLYSEEDAASYATRIEKQFVPNPRNPSATPQLVGPIEVEGLSGTRAWESTSSTVEYPRGLAWMVAGFVDRVVILQHCSWDGDSWSRDGANSAVTLQAAKVRSLLEHFSKM